MPGEPQSIPIAPAEPAAPAVVEDAAAVRRLIVRKLCDLVVLPAGRLTANERALAADVLLNVLHSSDVPLRREAAERLARLSDAPAGLISHLALDVIDVARPILEQGPVAPDWLVLEAARNGTEAHRSALASRADLTPGAADQLIAFGETGVLEALLRNAHVRLSPSAMDRLAAQAGYLERFQDLVLDRDELTPAHGFALFWRLSARRRRTVLTRFSVDRRLLQESLQDLFRYAAFAETLDPVVRDVTSLIERRRLPRVDRDGAASLETIAKAVIAIRRAPSSELVGGLAQLVGVRSATLGRVFADPGGEPVAILCKAVGLSRDTFDVIFHDEAQSEPVFEHILEPVGVIPF
ncbi:MAG: DUF2336 domain-containing protein, partial [Pseudomonadota bacterium]